MNKCPSLVHLTTRDWTITGYTIFETGNAAGSSTGTTFVVNGLSPQTTYTFYSCSGGFRRDLLRERGDPGHHRLGGWGRRKHVCAVHGYQLRGRRDRGDVGWAWRQREPCQLPELQLLQPSTRSKLRECL